MVLEILIHILFFFQWSFEAASTPTVNQNFKYINCFASLPSSFVLDNTYDFQTSSYCYNQCISRNYKYLALFNHSQCFCGNDDPTSSQPLSNSCDAYCLGYSQEICGGANSYSVYQIVNANEISNSPSISSTSITKTVQPSVVYSTVLLTDGNNSTIYVSKSITTQSVFVSPTNIISSTSTPTSTQSSNNNKKIYIGAIIGGVVGIVLLVVAVLFIVRTVNNRNKQRRMEMEYQEAIKPVDYDNKLYTQSWSSHHKPSIGSSDEISHRNVTNGNPFEDNTNNSLVTEPIEEEPHVLIVRNPDEPQ